MKRVIDTLNEMSFILPKGYSVVEEKYDLPNGQGFKNKENYLSSKGEVISLFEVHRDPEEFLESYQSLANDYSTLTDELSLEKAFNIKINDFLFPAYILKGIKDRLVYIVQVFVNCGDALACFMVNISTLGKNFRETIKLNNVLNDLVEILRSIE